MSKNYKAIINAQIKQAISVLNPKQSIVGKHLDNEGNKITKELEHIISYEENITQRFALLAQDSEHLLSIFQKSKNSVPSPSVKKYKRRLALEVRRENSVMQKILSQVNTLFPHIDSLVVEVKNALSKTTDPVVRKTIESNIALFEKNKQELLRLLTDERSLAQLLMSEAAMGGELSKELGEIIGDVKHNKTAEAMTMIEETNKSLSKLPTQAMAANVEGQKIIKIGTNLKRIIATLILFSVSFASFAEGTNDRKSFEQYPPKQNIPIVLLEAVEQTRMEVVTLAERDYQDLVQQIRNYMAQNTNAGRNLAAVYITEIQNNGDIIIKIGMNSPKATLFKELKRECNSIILNYISESDCTFEQLPANQNNVVFNQLTVPNSVIKHALELHARQMADDFDNGLINSRSYHNAVRNLNSAN